MSINNVFLVGHLGADPNARRAASGKMVCTLSVATNRRRAEGEPAVADWHRVVAFDRVAEQCDRYLAKGRLVAVEGRLSTRKWAGDDGKDRWTTEVLAWRVTFLGGAQGRGALAAPRAAEPARGRPATPDDGEPASTVARAGGAAGAAREVAEAIDDLPF